MTIYYASKYGAVSDAAEKINEYLGGRADLIDLGRQGMPKHMDSRGPVLVGGSIYAGTVMRPVREFCERHLQDLLSVKTGTKRASDNWRLRFLRSCGPTPLTAGLSAAAWR